jgi:PadR family transcriptional regulator PadR
MDWNKIKIQMRKWILEYIILLILLKKESYWWDILKILKTNKLNVIEWTLYPLLNRLVKDDFIEFSLVESSIWPKRKYYKITKLWGKNLKIMQNTFSELNNIIEKLSTNLKIW